MAVLITWSSTAGGGAISNVNHGSISNGTNTTEQQVFVRHDGLNSITAAGFYFAQKSGSYTGTFTAAGDFTEIVGWGDGVAANDFGGIQVNMDSEGTFSGGATWGMSESQKTSVDGLKYTVRTGVANSLGNKVLLSEKMSTSMSVDGILPAAVNNASFQLRIKAPTSETTTGTRQFDQVLSYTYTS
jgi:hypothetical protein